MKARTSTLLFAACFLSSLLMAHRALADDTNSTGWTAAIIETEADLREYGLPRYIVEVSFKGAFPIELVRSLSSYTLANAQNPERAIPLRAANPSGGQRTPAHKPNESWFKKVPGSPTASGVRLIPVEAIDPGADYSLSIVFGNISSPVIKVEALEPVSQPVQDLSKNEMTRIFELVTNLYAGRLSLALDGRAVFDGKKSPALDFQAGFDLLGPRLCASKDYWSGWLYSGALSAEGTLKLDENDTNVTDYLNFNANIQALYIFQWPDPFTRGGKLAYYIGARLKGIEIESDQRFEAVNLTVKPQLSLWVPYSNIPGLWWARSVGISGNAATPLSVFLGYTYANAIRSRPSKVNPDFQNSDRLETEFAYAFPLTSNLRVGTRVRLFWLFDEGAFRDYEELFVRHYLDNNKLTAVEFRYVHGSVPPKFEKGETLSAGFSVEF